MILGLLLLGVYPPGTAFSAADDSIDPGDGSIIRLAGVWTPYELFWNDPAKQTRWQARYAEEVDAWLQSNQHVSVNSGETDRYGRLAGDIITTADGASLRAHLLVFGLAVAAKGDDLRRREAIARAPGEESGMWTGAYEALCHTRAAQAIGSFGVIIGRIENAAVVGRTLYLNFGTDWRQDFTVSRRISSREEAPDTDALAGTWIEARGWVEWRGGPAIIISEDSQIARLGDDDFRKNRCAQPMPP
jgi:hypothetical protein